MKHIIDLNSEIEKIVNPEIVFHRDYQTFSFFGAWVGDIDSTYFDQWEARIKDKINLIADTDSPRAMKALKIFHQDILEKYDSQLKIDYEDLNVLRSIHQIISDTPKSFSKPENKCKEITFSDIESFGEYNFTMIKMANIFYSKDWEEYSLAIDPFDIQPHLEDLIIDKWDWEDEERLEEVYSFTYLSWCLETTRNILKNIARYIDYLLNFIKKIENYEEDKFSLEEISDNDPTNLKLEYKINKLDVVFLYRALFKGGVLDVDSKNQKYPDTNLRKYLDNANIYFLNSKGESVKVKGIGKEFSKVKNALPEEYGHQEIALLDLIIKQFTNRREKILESM